ncbi:MAG: hypothetical protein AAFO06_14135, partial [Cyanobacteria bacterium J06597_16]
TSAYMLAENKLAKGIDGSEMSFDICLFLKDKIGQLSARSLHAFQTAGWIGLDAFCRRRGGFLNYSTVCG